MEVGSRALVCFLLKALSFLYLQWFSDAVVSKICSVVCLNLNHLEGVALSGEHIRMM